MNAPHQAQDRCSTARERVEAGEHGTLFGRLWARACGQQDLQASQQAPPDPAKEALLAEDPDLTAARERRQAAIEQLTSAHLELQEAAAADQVSLSLLQQQLKEKGYDVQRKWTEKTPAELERWNVVMKDAVDARLAVVNAMQQSRFRFRATKEQLDVCHAEVVRLERLSQQAPADGTFLGRLWGACSPPSAPPPGGRKR